MSRNFTITSLIYSHSIVCLQLVILWSRDRSLCQKAPFVFLALQCRHGCSTNNVYKRRIKSSDTLFLIGRCVRCWYSSEAEHGDSTHVGRSMYERLEKIKSSGTSVTREKGAGHPSNSTIDKKLQQARELIMVNRFTITICRITVDCLSWCTLLVKRLSLHYKARNKNGVIRLKFWSRDHSTTI